MAAKQNILLHLEGVEATEKNDWLKAIAIFHQIDSPSAAIYFNIGCCYLQLKQFQKAELSFLSCVERDKYLAVGYFQLGVAQTLMTRYNEAIETFKACLAALRGNTVIHYKQLNLACKIFSSEVRLNLALLFLFTGDYNNALEELKVAVELESGNPHFVHQALAAAIAEDWDVFGQAPTDKLIMLSSSALFRPSKAKLDGIKSEVKFKNSAKVVSATSDEYSFVGFVGPVKLQREKESLAEASAADQLTPPVPSIAPPKRSQPPSHPPPSHPPPLTSSQNSSAYKPIPSPPSFSPPPLRKNKSPATSNFSSDNSAFDKSLAEKLQTQLTRPGLPGNKFNRPTSPRNISPSPTSKFSNGTPPRRRPPPPSKGSFKSDFQCNLITSLSITKTSIKNYDDFVNVVCEKLCTMAEDIKCGSTPIILASENKETVVNNSSWREIFVQGARANKLQLVIKEKSSLKPVSPQLSKPTPPLNKPSLVSRENEDDIYVDAKFGEENDDGIYSASVGHHSFGY